MEPTDAHCTLRPGRRSPLTVPEDDAAIPELAVESRVRTRAKGLLGTARFVGAIEHLPEGVWVGVELDEPLGKSDGEVKGVRIFQCAPLHGATLRASALQLVGPDGATLHDVPGHLPPPPKARRARKAAPGGGKKPLAEYEDDFMRLLDAARPESLPARREGVVDLKASNAANGLETSSFTVCARVRPVLAHEAGQPESYAVVLPTGGARRRRSRPGACGGGAAAEVVAAAVVAKDHTEHMTVFTPTVRPDTVTPHYGPLTFPPLFFLCACACSFIRVRFIRVPSSVFPHSFPHPCTLIHSAIRAFIRVLSRALTRVP